MKGKKRREFNIFDHELVPKHTVLPRKDVEKLLKKYHIRPHQLPYVKMSDPAAVSIGAKPGDIVKIMRRSQTAGEAVYYRYVIEE